MTDKYQAALHRIHEAMQFPTHYAKEFELLRHALVNCLPELPEDCVLQWLSRLENRYEVMILQGKAEEGNRMSFYGYGPTPRAAAIEAIKKIGGGE